MFSNRLPHSLEENDLWRALSRKRAQRHEILDLTASNPTRVGLELPREAILDALASPEALSYEPTPLGLSSARRAVASYYHGHGKRLSPDDIVLTSSTSEAYSFLFKLLCEPGDSVLVPRPSYPLHELLASLEAVESVSYPLDLGVPDSLPPRCRAVVAVHPNNPTGSHVSPAHAERMLTLSATEDVALIADEVFLDYAFARSSEIESFAGSDRGLVFVLSGLSKVAALPQMKLAWIVLAGASESRRAARDRLAHIADTYLSVGGPVQHAASRFLEIAPIIREAIQERLEQNLAALREEVDEVPAVSARPPAGGWYATLRLPAIIGSEAWAVDFLERGSVYLHPGDFFGFERDAHVVVSLLPPPEHFREAIRRVLGLVSDRVDSPGA